MELRYLGGADVRRLLTMRDCIAAMRDAMTLTAAGRAVQPIRTALRLPTEGNLLGMMPGYIAEPESFGIKIISIFPNNFGTGLSSHQGLVVVFEPEHGSPVGILDAATITAIRTAASSAVATDVLARTDARSLGIFGYGEQAVEHLEAMLQVRPFDRVLVWGRSRDSAAAFAREQALRHGVEVAPASCEEAAACDILCTVTAAPEPFLKGAWLAAGTHLNVVGSGIRTTAEIDVEAVVRSRVFTDYTASALALGGDLKRAIDAGRIDASHIVGCVGDVLSGSVPGRRSPDEITLFKSLGMAAEDLIAAEFILRRAREDGVGLVLSA